MSFLAPLYILGALSIAAPIVFHLIRRTPRGAVAFSSLMFLEPSPPTITRRSRLDNIPLLLLRALALGLLAFAFARPFFRRESRLDAGESPRNRVLVLIDTSASMRRGDLWARARAEAEEAIAACGPADQLAVYAFDATARQLLGFEESATLDPSRKKAVATGHLATLAPSWAATDLGRALVDAVGAIRDDRGAGEAAARMPRRIVLVGDLQRGGRLDALGEFAWPADVELDLKTVADPASNAGMQWLADAADSGPADTDTRLRVRVSNEPGSSRETFKLRWFDAAGKATGEPVDVYVPPGEGRVARVARLAATPELRLDGDEQPFDNTLYLAPARKDELTVLYAGGDAADDPAGLLYYLGRVYPETSRRSVRIATSSPAAPIAFEPGRRVPLVVVGSETSAGNGARLREFARAGGTVLAVLTGAGKADWLAAIADVPAVEASEAGGRDAMLGEIAFDHPMFAPLAGAQFNDFTKIHFWKHRRIGPGSLGDSRVLAKFDDGDPAILEKVIGRGRLVVMTAAWNPVDGQLGRSSKFLPMMAGLIRGRDAAPADEANLRVNDPIPLPAGPDPTRGAIVRKPDGSTATAAPGEATFAGADIPGVYTIEGPEGPRPVAVNLDPAESRTAPLAVETLEQYGCRLVGAEAGAVDPSHLRQLQNAELEGRQKLWRAAVVAAIVVLILETWLAGRIRRARPAPAEAATT